jgi:ATP-dependent helicase/nuclease subunit B
MPRSVPVLSSTALPAGEDFLDALAREVCARHQVEIANGDLSSLLVLVPALPVAADLRAAIARAAARPLLLPRFDTLARWVAASADVSIADAAPESQRRVLLHEALRRRGWFDETALWGIAAEIGELFDELSAAALSLPADEAELAAQLERAYRLRASAPLAFEARVVHELWRALTGAGALDAAAVYRLRLAAMLKDASPPSAPLVVVLDDEPAAALAPAEIDFLRACQERARVSIFHPASRSARTSPLLATLAAAWPEAEG